MRVLLAQFLLVAAVFTLSASAEQPSAEVQQLAKAFKGTWSLAIKDEPSPDAPKGEIYQGQEVWSEPGGGSIMEQWHAKSSAGDQHESGFYWWDPKAKQSHGLWCALDSDNGCYTFEWKWDGSALDIHAKDLEHGQLQAWHEVFVLDNPGAFTQKLYTEDAAGKQTLVSTIHGKKMGTDNKKP